MDLTPSFWGWRSRRVGSRYVRRRVTIQGSARAARQTRVPASARSCAWPARAPKGSGGRGPPLARPSNRLGVTPKRFTSTPCRDRGRAAPCQPGHRERCPLTRPARPSPCRPVIPAAPSRSRSRTVVRGHVTAAARRTGSSSHTCRPRAWQCRTPRHEASPSRHRRSVHRCRGHGDPRACMSRHSRRV